MFVFMCFSFLLLQEAFCFPTEVERPVEEARTYFSYWDNLNPFQWWEERIELKDQKLAALYRILECFTKTENLKDCETTANLFQSTFEKKHTKVPVAGVTTALPTPTTNNLVPLMESEVTVTLSSKELVKPVTATVQ